MGAPYEDVSVQNRANWRVCENAHRGSGELALRKILRNHIRSLATRVNVFSRENGKEWELRAIACLMALKFGSLSIDDDFKTSRDRYSRFKFYSSTEESGGIPLNSGDVRSV